MVLAKFVGEPGRGEHLLPKAIVMVGGEEKDEDVEESRRERPPTSSDKPTLLGVRDATEPAPVRMTVHGVAPPGPGSDRPPPMSAQEAAEARAISTSPAPPSPREDDQEGERSSHTRRSDELEAQESWSLPPLDRLPEELETQPESMPVPELTEQDREDLKNSSEDITSPDIELEAVYNARERFRTASGGGRNRESGGREHAAAYVAPLTLTPSAGTLGTASGIKVDNTVLQESRYHVTEPSLLVRRESTYPPHSFGHRGPTIGVLVMIVLVSAAAAAGAVYFSLKISEPPLAQRPRIVNLPDTEAERAPAARDRLAGDESASAAVRPASDAEVDDSPAAHAVAPRPRVRQSPKAAIKAAPQAEVEAELQVEAEAEARTGSQAEPQAEVDEVPLGDANEVGDEEPPVEAPQPKKETPEPWLE